MTDEDFEVLLTCFRHFLGLCRPGDHGVPNARWSAAYDIAEALEWGFRRVKLTSVQQSRLDAVVKELGYA